MIINDNIKLIRELSGKTQKEFARAIATKLSNLKTYENTDVKPKMPVIIAISDIANVSVEDLQDKKLSYKNVKIKKSGSKQDDKGEKDVSRGTIETDFDVLLKVVVSNFVDLKKEHHDIMNQHKIGRAELRAFVMMSSMKDARNDPQKLEGIMEIYDKLLGETLRANVQTDKDYIDGM